MYATEHKRSINDSVTSIDVKTHFHHEKQKYKQVNILVNIDLAQTFKMK